MRDKSHALLDICSHQANLSSQHAHLDSSMASGPRVAEAPGAISVAQGPRRGACCDCVEAYAGRKLFSLLHG